MSRPQHNCIRISNIKEWDRLPKEKSLFGQDDYHGLPIGDLLSQMCAGLYISPFVRYLQSLGFTMIANYVDDTIIVHHDKRFILDNIPNMRRFLWENLGLTLHHRKSYIQHTSKGVTFLGAIIKPHRMYCGHRTIANAFSKRLPKSLEDLRSTVNSYLGYFGQYRTYSLRKAFADKVFAKLGGKVYFGKKYLKIIIPKYKKKGQKAIYQKE